MKNDLSLHGSTNTSMASMQGMLEELMARVDALTADRAQVHTPQQKVQPQLIADAELVRLAANLLRSRRRRNAYLPAELLGEPAWDILLDLLIQEHQNKPSAVTSTCIASGAPPTTGLRWIAVLEKQELIARQRDMDDARRSYIHLTEKGRSAIKRTLMEYVKNLAT